MMSIERKMFPYHPDGRGSVSPDAVYQAVLHATYLVRRDKAVLSIVAWFVYIVWGHYHEGWRGRRVVWFNVTGAADAGLLVAAYCNSSELRSLKESQWNISTTTLIVTLIVLVISAYFSGSETGMMTLNRCRLRHMAKRAIVRQNVSAAQPDRLIGLVLIGDNLVNILASALGTIVGMRLYGDAGVAIAAGVLTFVVLVFAEVLPKPLPRSIRKGRLSQQPAARRCKS